MKMQLFVILLLCNIFSLSNAQTLPDSSKVFGDHSMQFRVYDFISLSSFKGTLLSYKHHTSDESAFRFGVSLRFQKYNTEESIERTHIDSVFLDQDRDHNYASIEIMAEYIKYFNPRDEVKVFMGIGPRVEFSIKNFDTDDVSAYGYSYTNIHKNNRYEFGLTFSYGLEWFFMKSMSLHAEYGFNLSYFYDEYKTENVRVYSDFTTWNENRETKQNGFEFDDTGAILGLSVYF
jgi:opacity protein-like surface antigen